MRKNWQENLKMKDNFWIQSNKGQVGVVRNPFERVVTLYFHGLDYIGLDNWVEAHKPELQVNLYKDCNFIIRLEHWERDLAELDIEVKDTSELERAFYSDQWRRWYTMRTRTHITELYHQDLMTFGYSY